MVLKLEKFDKLLLNHLVSTQYLLKFLVSRVEMKEAMRYSVFAQCGEIRLKRLRLPTAIRCRRRLDGAPWRSAQVCGFVVLCG
jgi:hypothetical protein